MELVLADYCCLFVHTGQYSGWKRRLIEEALAVSKGSLLAGTIVGVLVSICELIILCNSTPCRNGVPNGAPLTRSELIFF